VSTTGRLISPTYSPGFDWSYHSRAGGYSTIRGVLLCGRVGVLKCFRRVLACFSVSRRHARRFGACCTTLVQGHRQPLDFGHLLRKRVHDQVGGALVGGHAWILSPRKSLVRAQELRALVVCIAVNCSMQPGRRKKKKKGQNQKRSAVSEDCRQAEEQMWKKRR